MSTCLHISCVYYRRCSYWARVEVRTVAPRTWWGKRKSRGERRREQRQPAPWWCTLASWSGAAVTAVALCTETSTTSVYVSKSDTWFVTTIDQEQLIDWLIDCFKSIDTTQLKKKPMKNGKRKEKKITGDCVQKTNQTTHVITPPVAWRREAWKEEALMQRSSLRGRERATSSIRPTLELFQGQHWGNSRETRWSAYGPSRAHRYHLELYTHNWK